MKDDGSWEHREVRPHIDWDKLELVHLEYASEYEVEELADQIIETLNWEYPKINAKLDDMLEELKEARDEFARKA